MSRVSLTCAFFLLALVGCDRAAPDSAQEHGILVDDKTSLAVEVNRTFAGELMPIVDVSDPEGRQLNLGALQGRPVLINLWATWCAPCKKEMPLLDALAEEQADDLRVVAISQDQRNLERVSEWFAQRKFAMLEPWMEPEATLLDRFGSGLPTTILYDASGSEVWRIEGDFDWSSAEAAGLLDEAID